MVAAPRKLHAEGLELKDAKRVAVQALEEYDRANPSRTQAEVLPAPLRETGPESKMLDDQAALEGELGEYRERLAEHEIGKGLHMGVADEPRPDFPDIEPTTEKNLNTLDEMDDLAENAAAVEAHIQAMEREGLLDDAMKRELAEAADERKAVNKWADTYEDAALCVVRNR